MNRCRFAAFFITLCSLVATRAVGQTVTYQDGQPVYTSPLSVTSPNTLSLQLDLGAAEQSGVISGTGSIAKIGAGTLTLSGTNTYAGSTTISAGTLTLGSASQTSTVLPDATDLTVAAGATFDIGNHVEAIGTLSGAGTVTGTAGSSQLTIRTAANTTFSGTLSNVNVNRNSTLPNTLGALTLTGVPTGTVSLTAFSGTILVNNASASYTNASIDGVNGSVQIFNGTLTGNVSITGSGTPNGNAGLRIGNGGTTGTLAANVLLSDGYLTFNRSDDVTYGFDISGFNPNSVVMQNSAATLTFTANNSTYSGKVQIFGGGTIQFGNGGTGGMLPGNVSLLSGSGSVVFNRADDFSYSYSLSVSNVTKLGAGTVTLTNTGNSWSSLAINAGTVKLGAANVIPDNSVVSIGASGTLNLNSFSETIGALSGSGAITLGTGTLTVSSSASSAFSGNVTGGTGGFTKAGSGTLTLSGNNAYSGATTISAGTLALRTSTALPSASAVTVSSGATLDVGGATATAAALSGAGGVNLHGGSFSVGGANSSTTFSGILSDSAGGTGSFTKTGTGTLILSGGNTYTGATTISGGALQIGAGGATGALASATITDNAALNFNTTSAIAMNATISGTGAVTQAGSGAVTLGGNNSYSGGTTLGAGRLSAGNASALGSGTITLSGGLLANLAPFSMGNGFAVNAAGGTIEASGGDLSLSGNFSGTGPLAKTGVGNLTLSGSNGWYTGTVTISAGTLTGNTASLSGNLVNNAALVLAQDSDGVYGGTLSGSGAFTKTGVGVLTLTGNNALYTGPATISTGTLALGQTSALGTGAVTVAAPATLDVGTGSFDLSRLQGAGRLKGSGALSYGAAADLALTNVVTGTTSLTMNGTGTLTVSGLNDYSGGTTVNAGTVAIAADSALGTGTLRLNGGALQATSAAHTLANAVTLAGDVTFSGDQTLTLAGAFTLANNRDLTVTSTVAAKITGVIGQSGGTRALLKYGAGELDLTGANTYTGGTTIAEGTVRINNSTGSAFGTGAVTVETGATLTGAGSFSGALQNNGTYAPGNSPAFVTLSTFNMGSTGILQMELGGLSRGTGYDAVAVTGALTLGGTLDVSFYNGFTAGAGDSFDILDWGSASGTFSSVDLPALSNGLTWDTSALYTTGTLSVAPVPEPAESILLVGSSLFLALRRQRAGRCRKSGEEVMFHG